MLALLLAAGAFFSLSARRLPLVRNSLVYARASEHVIAHGYDPRPVVADSALSYDKPILYAWLSAPFVAALGNHDGLRLTSFLTTAAYLLALLHFARSFRALLPPGGALQVLWLGALGPCVFYQLWSAHPDGWFAALVVLAWSLSRRLVVERAADPLPRVLALGATILLAILLKNYGLVLCISCPLYLVWHQRELRLDARRFRRLAVSALGVAALLAAFVALAWTGHNPLARLEGEGGGVGQYGSGELWRSARGAWVGLGLALLLQFQVALAFALRRRAWSKELWAPLACFGAPYVLGLMPFPTTFYNMRYFVPLFALGALLLARGALLPARGAGHPALGATRATRATFLAHGLLGVLLVVLFNWAPAYRAAAPWLPDLRVNWIGVPLSLLDNLRMELHLEQALVLDSIDAHVAPGATLVLLDVNYYGDAQQGVYERAGLIRSDIRTRYASAHDFRPGAASFYLWRAPGRPLPAGLGDVAELGHGLCHVRRDG